MPRQLCNQQKIQIISELQKGRTIREVAFTFGVNKSTVQNVKNRWEQEQTINRKQGSGRRRISLEHHDTALVNFLRERPFSCALDAVAATNFPGSRSTACRRIQMSDIKNCIAAKKSILSERHKQGRIIFALNYLYKDIEFWNKVIFTDEKTFQSTYNRHIKVYRPRNTRYEESYVSNAGQSQRFSVNVWAAITANGLAICWRIDGRFNALAYLNILENIIPLFREHHPHNNFILQQDNCSVHTAGIITQWLQTNNIETLIWPSKCPDVNIIENIWGIIVKKMYERHFRPNNREELWNAIIEAWQEITENENLIRNLYSSIPLRLTNILNADGAMTKY